MKKNIQIISLSILGAVATWWINAQLGLGPAVASGIIGLLAALILPTDLAVATYTASFVGMSSALVITGLPMTLIAGIFVGVIFALALPVYQGFGGKLGTIAACAVLATVFIFGLFGQGV